MKQTHVTKALVERLAPDLIDQGLMIPQEGWTMERFRDDTRFSYSVRASVLCWPEFLGYEGCNKVATACVGQSSLVLQIGQELGGLSPQQLLEYADEARTRAMTAYSSEVTKKEQFFVLLYEYLYQFQADTALKCFRFLAQLDCEDEAWIYLREELCALL